MSATSRLALIDDDRVWRDTLAEYLQTKGFEVYPAEDARRGFDLLSGRDIPLAVIDFHLGDDDGLELLRRLRRHARPIAALLMSSDDDPTLPARALAEGAHAFLSKTVAPALFLHKLLDTLRTARPYYPLIIHRTIWLPVVLARDPRQN
jgi:DNA-binding NarL/FixJ family response regulator